jgi:16S rRNA (cytosine1402-N4)-methyltransferase
MSQEFSHRPVMLEEVVALFAPVPPGLLVDATVGGAGHGAALLAARRDARLLGLDRDEEAVAAARRRLAEFGARAEVRHARFDEIGEAVAGLGVRAVSGILFDLGVSSHQLDRAERGFSYQGDGPLDMRMDRSGGVTASSFLDGTDEATLTELFVAHGETRFARRIARALLAQRPILSTAQLADAVTAAIPAAARRRGHPARRVFQALRVAVNEELELLGPALDAAIDLLAPGGRIVVLSYHSGEDRIAKDRLRTASTGGCVCPPGLPCVCGAVPRLRLLNRGARLASAEEIAANPRAEAVRLRAGERLAPPTDGPA